ncbi:hypothetical protein [Mycetohabitans sp. B46]|uniref:hypothetical protein n=1 Tax=Mycetohabitans sp. B46 TaxID=2772536 RepID=UPI00307FBFC0
MPNFGPNLSNLTPEQRSEYYCNLAADYARRSAERDSNGDPLHKKENEDLISKGNICWDAVKDCAFKAGAISKDQYKLINGKTDLVTPIDKRIHNANELESVPPGHILEFFGRGETEPFHVMLTTGDNKAASNKNQCLEIGNAAGWEELDLSQLTPFNGIFIINYPKKDVYYKPFVVTYRPISEAGKQPSNEASTSAQV